jgi:hypothetical protein
MLLYSCLELPRSAVQDGVRGNCAVRGDWGEELPEGSPAPSGGCAPEALAAGGFAAAALSALGQQQSWRQLYERTVERRAATGRNAEEARSVATCRCASACCYGRRQLCSRAAAAAVWPHGPPGTLRLDAKSFGGGVDG